MCRNKEEGGRRCPHETNPVAVAERNAKRREAYKLKKNSVKKLTPEAKTLLSNLAAPAPIAPEVEPVPVTVPQPKSWGATLPEFDDEDFQEAWEERVFWTHWTEIVSQSKQEMKILTKKQEDAIYGFTHQDYTWVNGGLFGKKVLFSLDRLEDDAFTGGGEASTKEMVERVNLMDAAFAKSPLRERIVYRGKGVNSPRFKQGDQTPDEYIKENYALGSEIVFDGYQSTSLDPTIAGSWAGEGGIIFEMKSRSGINVTSASHWQEESEVLLPRSSRWKVVSVRKNQIFRTNHIEKDYQQADGMTVIQMVEVGEDGKELTQRTVPEKFTIKDTENLTVPDWR